MKKALVFVAAFALVLVAGVAVAFMTTPGDDAAGDTAAVDKPTTTTSVEEKEQPPTTEKAPEPKGDKEPPKEPKKDEPKTKAPEKEEAEKPVVEKDTTPPELVILFPENGQHFDEQKVAFEGKTEPGAKVYAGDYEADVDAEGNWRIVLILTNKGGNLATFKAMDEAGNKTTASVKAYYDAPSGEKEEPKEEKEPKTYEFSATQKYGSCSSDPAYDKWYGKGEPGTRIWIESPYGGGETEVNKHGEWYLKVHFPEAPCGETFQIVLETDEGHRKTYDFVRLCEEPKDKGHNDEGHKDK